MRPVAVQATGAKFISTQEKTMLVCNVSNIMQQIQMNDRMQKAVDFLMQANLQDMPAGRVEIDGDAVYVRVLDLQTIPPEQGKFEAHKNYIDIHFVADGKEAIAIINTEKLVDTDEYNPLKDVFHGRPGAAEEVSQIVLSRGELAVLYPDDAHAPTLMVGAPAHLKKIVVKVAV
jgi:YhcH/YjgK/YiaL family protein